MGALTEGLWYEHTCFPGMGVHVADMNRDADQNCNNLIFPMNLLYHSGSLIGFITGNFVDQPGLNWEYPTWETISGLYINPAMCFKEIFDARQANSIHFYFVNPLFLGCE